MSNEILQVLDLGAGTGLASLSFFNLYPHSFFTLVDPDAGMLSVAEKSLSALGIEFETVVSAAENFETGKRHDLALVASAWHWMEPHSTLLQLTRQLKPGAILFVFEYQFPKALGAEGLGLTEWTRREFNLRWKAPGQKPRGSLQELTLPLRASPHFCQLKKIEWEQTEDLVCDEYLGLIFSQSRYLAYEQSLSFEMRAPYREQIKSQVKSRWEAPSSQKFLYSFQGYLYQLRNL